MTTRKTSKLAGTLWPISLLALAAVLYAIMLYVRTLQSWKWFGDTVDIDPIAARLRALDLLVGTSPDQLRWTSYALFLAIVAVYGAALWLSWRQQERSPSSIRARYLLWAILPYVTLGLVSLAMYPHVSRPTDTIDYAMHARVQLVYGENPYVVPGSAHASQDQLVQYMEARQRASVYGPAWQILSLLPGVAGAGLLVSSMVAFKLLFFLAGLICLWLLWVFYARAGRADPRMLVASGALLGWSPALHLISHGEGHNDILMGVFLAGAIVLLARDRPIAATASWCLSALVKFISAPLLAALIACIYAGQRAARARDRLRPVVAGLALSGVLALLAIAPFGSSAVLASIFGRYGGLLGSGGDSKISLAAGMLSRALRAAHIDVSTAALASLVGLALPLLWAGYCLARGGGARDIDTFVKVAVESFLIYLTLVAIPVYAQYVITPVVLGAFLGAAKWHRAAVLVASLALVWDSLFLVYLTPGYPAWEGYLHQLSHVVVIAVPLLYLAAKLIGGAMPRYGRISTNAERQTGS